MKTKHAVHRLKVQDPHAALFAACRAVARELSPESRSMVNYLPPEVVRQVNSALALAKGVTAP